MKILFYIILFIGVFCKAGELISKELDYPIESSGVYFGARASRIEWKAGTRKFFGYFLGPSAGIDYRKPHHIYGGYRFFWLYGNTKAGNCQRRMDDMDMQGRVGYTYGKTLLMTPYTGLGVNAITRKKQHTQAVCHKLSYTGVYVPIGIFFSYHTPSRVSFGIDYQYMMQVDSYYKMSGFKHISFELKERGSQSLEFPIQFSYPKPRFHNVQYRIVPFCRTYFYGNAKLICDCTCECNAAINLPRQRGYEWGIRYEVAIW
jgi:hypothetical protein